MVFDDDKVVVVFTREQALLVDVLLTDPHLHDAEDPEQLEVTEGAQGAVNAGLAGA